MLNHTMNHMGAETYAGYALHKAGVVLSNPCLHVNAFHWHCAPKMHSESTVPYLEAWEAVHSSQKFAVFPCWHCPGTRTPRALCASGAQEPLREPLVSLFFRDMNRSRLCCPLRGRCDQRELHRLWKRNRTALPRCDQVDAPPCVVP